MIELSAGALIWLIAGVVWLSATLAFWLGHEVGARFGPDKRVRSIRIERDSGA